MVMAIVGAVGLNVKLAYREGNKEKKNARKTGHASSAVSIHYGDTLGEHKRR